jgi:hypothetical protein
MRGTNQDVQLSNAGVVSGEIVSRELAGGAPHAPAQPKVIVDRSAYTVEPGHAGMLKALGLDPSKTSAVAHASDGHGADFDVVASPAPPKTGQTGTGAGGTKTPGTGTKPDTVEQYKQRGGIVQEPKYGESGLKRPPEPKPEINARPKEQSFEEEREEKLGPAEDSPEVAANQSGRKSPGGAEPPVRAEVGNFAHNKLPGYLDRMRADLASAKSPEARAKLEQQIDELEAMTEWPAGLEPNRLSFTMSDGRPGIPDGIDVKTGKVYELKPDTESEWAKGGDYQASEYAKVLNEMRYAGRTDWEGEVIVYKATEMTAKLRKWGVLPPEPPPKTK